MRNWVIVVALAACGGTQSTKQPQAGPLVEDSSADHTTAPPGGTHAEIAARSAAEGQALFAEGKFAEASSKYMDAVARVPESRYFYLLAQARYREGKFTEALTACDAAEKTNPNAALLVKIRELRTMIRTEANNAGLGQKLE